VSPENEQGGEHDVDRGKQPLVRRPTRFGNDSDNTDCIDAVQGERPVGQDISGGGLRRIDIDDRQPREREDETHRREELRIPVVPAGCTGFAMKPGFVGVGRGQDRFPRGGAIVQ
jgi:hypothetical protein